MMTSEKKSKKMATGFKGFCKKILDKSTLM